MHCQSNSAAAGQTDVEKWGAFAEAKISVRALNDSRDRFRSNSGFGTTARDVATITAITTDSHLSAERARSTSTDFDKRHQCTPQSAFCAIGCIIDDCRSVIGHKGTDRPRWGVEHGKRV
jgi:hypothetical protein